MFARPRRGFRDGPGNCRRTTFGNDHAIGAGSVGSTQDRAQVVRIFYTVEYDNEGILSPLRFNHIIEIAVLFGRCDSYHSLVRGVAGHAIEFCARHKTHRNGKAAAVFDHALQTDVVPLLRHANPLKGASTGLERLGDGVDAVDIVHKNGGQLSFASLERQHRAILRTRASANGLSSIPSVPKAERRCGSARGFEEADDVLRCFRGR